MVVKLNHKSDYSGTYLSSYQSKGPLSTGELGPMFALNTYFFPCPTTSSHTCWNEANEKIPSSVLSSKQELAYA